MFLLSSLRRFHLALFLVVTLGGTLNALGQAEIKTIRNWFEFQELINKNHVRSIDELLAVLPRDFKNGYGLIYRTQALHRELVSPERPRVLMFGTLGTFMMTYNSHPDGGLAKVGETEGIETIEFKNGQAYLREITFDGVKNPFGSPIPVNPAKCTVCHGANPRGLWDPYNMWPGVYGSISRGGFDFIKLGTPEYEMFQSYLKEKEKNPRYQVLKGEYILLSEQSKKAKILRPFDPAIMNDALTIADGNSTLPNQRIGMIIGEQNLHRLGTIVSQIPMEKRKVFQYLIKGMMLDEKYDPADVKKKTFPCLTKIDGFFPAEFWTRKTSRRAKFADFLRELNVAVAADYTRVKSLTEIFNLGLSSVSAGFNSDDPLDLQADARKLIYDPIPMPLFVSQQFGLSGYAVLAYTFHILGLPDYEMSTAINSGRFNFYNGAAMECFTSELGEVSSATCVNEPVEAFFTRYLDPKFFVDRDLDQYTCDELAVKSQAAIAGARINR